MSTQFLPHFPIFVKKSLYSGKYDRVEPRFGYRIKTTDYIYTTLGIGRDLKKGSPAYRIMLSVSFTSPHEKKEVKKIFEEE